MNCFKQIFTLCFFSFLMAGCSDDDTSIAIPDNLMFSDLSLMPVPLAGMGYTDDGASIYISNGFSPTALGASEVYQYDIAAESWSLLTSDLEAKRYGNLEYLNGQLYAFNGQTSTGDFSNMEVIDLQTGEVTLGAVNENPRQYAGSAVWDNKIYTFGGSILGTDFRNELYVFDPETNTWSELAPMPEGKQTNGVVVNGELYVFGGFLGVGTSAAIDKYSIAENSWSNVGALPQGVSAHAVTTHDHLIFIVGSYDDLDFLGAFDTNTNEFTEISSNMLPRRHAGASVVNAQLFIYGGGVTSNITSALNSLQKVDL